MSGISTLNSRTVFLVAESDDLREYVPVIELRSGVALTDLFPHGDTLSVSGWALNVGDAPSREGMWGVYQSEDGKHFRRTHWGTLATFGPVDTEGGQKMSYIGWTTNKEW